MPLPPRFARLASGRIRIITAFMGVAAFALPLLVVLATHAAGVAATPLVGPPPSWESVPVAIPGATYVGLDGRQVVHRLQLTTRDVGSLAGHSQIRLLVATHGTFPKLTSGDLALRGTPCVYRTVRGTSFADNTTLAFVRGASCSPLQGTPTGQIQLTLRFSVGGQPALWTFVPPAGADLGGSLIVTDPAAPESSARPVVRGTLADAYPASSARRIALLAYVWQISPSAPWIEWTLIVSCALLALGLCLLMPDDHSGHEGVGPVVTCAVGGFCVAGAIALAYAIVVPPFQAADEPNHFMGFAAFVKRPGMDVEAANWARLGHFERIQFHSEEHFRPPDRGNPGIPWNDGGEPDSAARGAGIEFLWRAVGPFVQTLPAPKLLLALRVINVMIFSASVAAFMGLVGIFSGMRWPQLAAVPLFLVPTLPFFGMAVSNYSLLVGAYVILGGGVVVAIYDGPRSAAAGGLIGGGWSAAILISRSAIPLAPFVGAVLIARLVLGSRERGLRQALVFWLGFSACVAAGVGLADPAYVRSITGLGQSRLPASLAALFFIAVTHPWVLPGFGVAAAVAEYLVSRSVRACYLGGRMWLRRATIVGTFAAAALAVVLFAGPFLVPYPTLHLIDPAHPPEAGAYAKSAILAGLTLFRFAQPDFLTSVSFWGGFGWLDTLLPNWLVSALTATSGVALVSLLLWIARTASVRAAFWLACATAGYGLSLAAYAFSIIRVTPADLHGRYLMGLYLCVLLVTWSALPRAVDAGWLRRPSVVIGAVALCSVAVHAFALTYIVLRYF